MSRAHAIGSVEIDSINYLNIGLMIVSMVLAAYLPFEMFIAAYAILGPLHYLTEISWLHDRDYFSSGRYYWLILLLPLVPQLPYIGTVLPHPRETLVFLTSTSVIAAVGMACARSHLGRVSCVALGMGLGLLAQRWGALSIVLLLLLPTVIHVYLFTGLFIIYGALKGRSLSGALSGAVFLATPYLLSSILTTPPAYQASSYALRAAEPFMSVCRYLARTFGVGGSDTEVLSAMRFLAFAYTYHYLNWFSKTRIINWHNISRRRLTGIVVLYILSLATYAISYEYGFLALVALSFSHVVLEFPLNVRSMVGIASETKALIAGRCG
jgi:hypothetical protein